LHHRLTRRAAWLDHDGALPIIDGTLIRLQVEQLPGERDPKPVWLWTSAVAITQPTWTGSGRHSSEDSILSTRSGCGNRPWAGPETLTEHQNRRVKRQAKESRNNEQA
jgi:hypothetical protein